MSDYPLNPYAIIAVRFRREILEAKLDARCSCRVRADVVSRGQQKSGGLLDEIYMSESMQQEMFRHSAYSGATVRNFVECQMRTLLSELIKKEV
jgi:hypothetical protein